MIHRPAIVALALALAACSGAPPTKAVGSGPPAPRRTASPSPGAAATAPPSRAPLVAAGAVAVLNAAPAAGTRPLDATIVLDAGWLLSNNGGSVIGGAIALGSGLNAPAEGNPIVPDARAAMFSAGTLVSEQGGALVSNNGGAYRLAQAGAKLGEGLPAANAVVGAIDPLTAEPIPVGVDAAGQQVWAVRSDARGRVRLHLPAATAGYIRLVALGPAGGAPLLQGYVSAEPAAAAPVLDEAEGQFVGMIRSVLVSRFTRHDLSETQVGEGDLPAPAIAVLERLRVIMVDVGASQASPRRRQALYATTVDPMCTGLDLDAIPFTSDHAALKAEAPASTRQLLRTIFGRIEAAAALRLQADPRAFDGKPYVVAASTVRRLRIGQDAVVRKPTDLLDQVVTELLVTEPGAAAVEALLADLGLDPLDAWRIEDAGRSLLAAALTNLLAGVASDGRPLLDVVEAIVKAQGPAILAVADPAGLPPEPPVPAPLAYADVLTLAGRAPGYADGPPATSAFDRPQGLALDESRDPPRLYVGDAGNHVIRRILLPPGGEPVVDTIAGAAGQAGTADGAGAAARFSLPRGVALDAEGRLLVADEGNQAVRRLTFDAAGAVTSVATLATGVPLREVGADAQGGLWLGLTASGRVARLGSEPGATPAFLAGGGQLPPLGAGLGADLGRLEAVLPMPGGGAWLGMGDGQVLALDAAGRLEPLVGARGSSDQRAGLWMNAVIGPVLSLAAVPGGRYLVLGGNEGISLAEPGTRRAWPLTGTHDGPETGEDGPVDNLVLDRVSGLAVGRDGTIYFVEKDRHRVRRLRPAR